MGSTSGDAAATWLAFKCWSVLSGRSSPFYSPLTSVDFEPELLRRLRHLGSLEKDALAFSLPEVDLEPASIEQWLGWPTHLRGGMRFPSEHLTLFGSIRLCVVLQCCQIKELGPLVQQPGKSRGVTGLGKMPMDNNWPRREISLAVVPLWFGKKHQYQVNLAKVTPVESRDPLHFQGFPPAFQLHLSISNRCCNSLRIGEERLVSH